MKKSLILFSTACALSLSGLMIGTAHADPAANKSLVEKAMTELFVNRDVTAPERYWAEKYVQHNPSMGNGREDIIGAVKQLPPNFKYEIGNAVAEGDLVMVHGRYLGFGPKPLVAVDIFRITDGKIAEHWDVLQEEVPAAQTKSGNPMFEPKK